MTRPATVAAPSPSRPPRVRSAISNGRLPGGVSRCSAAGRRFADIEHDLIAEMGGSLTPAETLQVRAVAGLVMHAEQLQAAILLGQAIDSEQFVRVSNSAARLLTALRRRKAERKPTGPTVAEYLSAKRAGAAA